MARVASRLGNKIRSRRRELGLTQGQLGKRVGKSQVAVSEWERGAASPSDLTALAHALEVPQEELAMAAATGFLDADDVEAAIWEAPLPVDVRQFLITIYKAVLSEYGPKPERV